MNNQVQVYRGIKISSLLEVLIVAHARQSSGWLLLGKLREGLKGRFGEKKKKKKAREVNKCNHELERENEPSSFWQGEKPTKKEADWDLYWPKSK